MLIRYDTSHFRSINYIFPLCRKPFSTAEWADKNIRLSNALKLVDLNAEEKLKCKLKLNTVPQILQIW